jgi:alanine racemase
MSTIAEAHHAGATLTVDLGAIRANYRLLRSRLGATVCAAVIKADTYGLGAAAVAPALAAEGCRQFFVAHLDEALALRPLLPVAEIFVLNGLPPGAEADCAGHRVTPVLISLAQIDAWAAHGRRLDRALPAALQVDSGISRLGLGESEVFALAEDPRRLEGIGLRLFMSHLACAERQDDRMNQEQLRRFKAARALLPPAPASLANSSGIFLGTDFHFDLSRPGAALYGLAPVAGSGEPDATVRLRGRIMQTREVVSGTAIGYGASWRAAAPRRIATVAVGYADGYLQSLGNRATARRRHSRPARWHRFDGHRDLRHHRRARRGRGRLPRADRPKAPCRRARQPGRDDRLRNPHLPWRPLLPHLRGRPHIEGLTA